MICKNEVCQNYPQIGAFAEETYEIKDSWFCN